MAAVKEAVLAAGKASAAVAPVVEMRMAITVAVKHDIFLGANYAASRNVKSHLCLLHFQLVGNSYFARGILPMKKKCIAVATLSIGLLINNAVAEKNSASPDDTLTWQTVANNADIVPGDSAGRPFNSYNPPSVNSGGFVVFRGRSRGPEPPASGIFARDMSRKRGSDLYPIATRGMTVPSPNNTGADFNEFPSFARLGLHNQIVATRGNSNPVWQYETPDGESRIGTSGIYIAPDGMNLETAITQLGLVPGFAQFMVPGVATPTRFDQFPGAPSPTDEGYVLTKGNYTLNENRQTGVFFQNLFSGNQAVELIANTATKIPNVPENANGLTFGSTAPPSASKNKVVFVGYDNEESPSYGGIYLADIQPQPPLKTLIGIGNSVPGVTNARFTRFGEGLTFNGHHVAFWGTWGTETRTLRLHCPTEGNRDRREYCRNDDPNTNRDTDERWQEKEIPVNQGIFVHDTQTGNTLLIAHTGEKYNDFLYWNYSGRPPGTGEGDTDAEDSEPPRWRSATFIAVSNNHGGAAYAMAFKARSGEINEETRVYENFIDGVYFKRGPGKFPIATIVDTTMPGDRLDAETPSSTFINSLGLERDGFRGNYLAITASMEDISSDEDESTWAGIYVTDIPEAFGRH
ncbi:MAG: hypothetical protein H6936_04710 [Burkholderiales bacterium]|nr:hypothetical protein [Burkholderiales bacterium]